MELTENKSFVKYATQTMHCLRKTLLPYEHEWTCPSCGYDVKKRQNEPTKIQRKEISFISRLRYAEKNYMFLYRCVDDI